MNLPRFLRPKFLDRALFRTNGVARRLTVFMILFSSAVTAVITAAELYGDYHEDMRGVHARIDTIQNVYLPTLTESVWVAETPQIQNLLSGLLNLGNVERLEVVADGKVQWAAGARSSKRTIETVIPLVRAHRGENLRIGELHVVASVDQVYERLWSKLIVMLLSNGIKTFLVTLFVLLLFQDMVGQHLEHLSGYLRKLGRTGAGQEALKLNRPATGLWRPDALDHVTNAVNQMQTELLQLAFHDPLTGLPNRLLLQERFAQAIAIAARHERKVALLFLDLDNFKGINDNLGHDVGDALLKDMSARLKGCIRETDTICRQGGDEFLIILADLRHTEEATPVIAKIMEQLQHPFMSSGSELSTSVSIGVGIFPDDGTTLDTLHKKADMAMYQAKDAGRNTYRFFDAEINSQAADNLAIRNSLHRALERNEFVLHYQPQFDLATRRVFGVEALLRWNNPILGAVAPVRFIPVAEESGLIVPIGNWVLQEACRQAAAWQAAGLPELTVAVNLSALQFKRDDVEQQVRRALAASGLNPARLELELTESILIQNVESVQACVNRLKQLGVKISIDDFGTGYSSLAYLKQLDIDKLKIDRSFVRDLDTDPDDAAIVNAVIQMARSLGIRTIAEGVETEAIFHQLRLHRCDEAQGYYLARPMPADALVEFLSDPARQAESI